MSCCEVGCESIGVSAKRTRPEDVGQLPLVGPGNGIARELGGGNGYRLERVGDGATLTLNQTPTHLNAPELRKLIADLAGVVMAVESV